MSPRREKRLRGRSRRVALIVRNSKGRTVSATKLATEARDAREVCEGEAEG